MRFAGLRNIGEGSSGKYAKQSRLGSPDGRGGEDCCD